jgi:hypothetical protein
MATRQEDQFDGVLVSRDELAGWLNGIAEYKGAKEAIWGIGWRRGLLRH